MRKLRVWGVAATLALGLAAARGAADGPPSPGLLGPLFARPPARPKEPDPDESAARQEEARERARAERRSREAQEARVELLRRLAVCDRLEGLAGQSGDANLESKAAELRARAWDVYRKKTETVAEKTEEKAPPRKPADKPKPGGKSDKPFRASHPWRVSS